MKVRLTLRTPDSVREDIAITADPALTSLQRSSDPAARTHYADLIARSQRYAGTVESHRRLSLSE